MSAPIRLPATAACGIYGHRGACAVAPENTLASFDAAIAMGVAGVECDIQLSKDGIPIVIHDDTLERTTNGTGCVKDHSLAALQQLNAGEHEGKTQRIVSLKELLDHINGRCPLFIEIKHAEATHTVVEHIMQAVIHGNWRYEQLICISFDHTAIYEARKLCEHLRTGAIFVGTPVSLAAMAEEAGAWSIHPGHKHLTPAMVEDAHRRNLHVLTWTVNTPQDRDRMQEMGVDGIFSDNPARL